MNFRKKLQQLLQRKNTTKNTISTETVEFDGPPVPKHIEKAKSMQSLTEEVFDLQSKKYKDKYPTLAYYLSQIGKLRGERHFKNESDWIPVDNDIIHITGTKNTNVPVLRSILNVLAMNGAKSGVSPYVALGIPVQETKLGYFPTAAWRPNQINEYVQSNPNGYTIGENGGITPVELLNNAAYSTDPYMSGLSYSVKKLHIGVPIDDTNYIFKNDVSEEQLQQLENMLIKDKAYTDKKASKWNGDLNVFQHAYNLYKEGNYNPGDPNYSSDVENSGRDLFSSPEIQKWWKESGKKYYQQYAPQLINGFEYKNGGTMTNLKRIEKGKSGIHIKPENKGKLTRLKRVTGKTEAELWRTGNASTRKMITFARNARKWKK